MFTLTPLVLVLLPHVLSAPTMKNEPSIEAFAGTFNCPSHLRHFRASSSIIIPETTPERVWAELGNFCETDWQGFEVTSTHGACNSLRSLRTYRAAELELTERLDYIHTPSTSSSSRFHAFLSRPAASLLSSTTASQAHTYAHGYTMLNRPTIAGADVIRMKSMLKVGQSGSDTYVKWDVIGCSDYPEHLADKLEEVHQGALWLAEERIMESKEELLGVKDALRVDMKLMEQVMEAVTLA